ncbi:MAG: hypothetical protein LBK12_08735 [Odoribacteraceae bacterium]|jgi:hypothetical protein|nr:hypothetical protein [Odoribacteraceae bacterium]
MKTRYSLIPALALAALMLSCEADKLDIGAPDVNVNGGPLLESLTPTSARVQVIVSRQEGVKEVGVRYGLQTDRAALVTYGETLASAEKKTEHFFDIVNCESATKYSYVAYALLENGEIAYSVVRSFTTIAAELTVTPSRLSLGAPARSDTLRVATTFDAWDVIVGSEEWFTCRAEGPLLVVTTRDNLTAARRVATLKFTAGSRTLNLAVTQDPPLLSLAPVSVTLPATGGGDHFTVASDIPAWTVDSDVNWLTFSVDGDVVTFQAGDSGGVEREGHLTVTIGTDGVFKVFTVLQ